MTQDPQNFIEDYLFSVHNFCGEYSVHIGNLEEDDDSVTFVIKPKSLSADEVQQKALPYLQKICNKAFRENEDLIDLQKKLERFGDPHWYPIPWKQEPLPEGAIE